MLDGLDEFDFFGRLPGPGAVLVEDGERASIGEPEGVVAFVGADLRAAREAGETELQVGAVGAQHAQTGNALLTVVAEDVCQRHLRVRR